MQKCSAWSACLPRRATTSSSWRTATCGPHPICLPPLPPNSRTPRPAKVASRSGAARTSLSAPDLLATFAAEFQDPKAGLLTCPYRAVPGPSFWSRLEAIGLNTEFLAGVLVARLLDGMHFALGPAIAARRQTLSDIGGFHALKDYLAEDFVMGKFAAELGWRVILSSCVIEHHIGTQPFGPNLAHRLRWNRSTRRSRPLGYIGQIFTNPLPLAVLFCVAVPDWWPVLLVTGVFRALAARSDR